MKFVVVNIRLGRFFCNQGVSETGVLACLKHGFVGFGRFATAIWVVHFGSVKTCKVQFLAVEIRALAFEGT